jgi:hypothetical protein
MDKPCSRRLANGGWCLLPDGHPTELECSGVAYRLGPEMPPPDVMLRRRQQREARELAEATGRKPR